MTLQILYRSSLLLFIVLSSLTLLLYFSQYSEYVQYIDSALFFLGISTLFLFSRKYLTQSYTLEKHRDFFLIDFSLLLFGALMFFCYFYFTIFTV